MATAREMIETIDVYAEKTFAKHGEVMPCWLVETKDGQIGLLSPPHEDKDLCMALVRALFEVIEVRCYVYISEAWTLQTTNKSEREARIIANRGIADHPDRNEILLYAAEDENGMIMAHRNIIRLADAKPTLAPIEYDKPSEMEGRMVGLLPSIAKGN
jgi:hypothetical protein